MCLTGASFAAAAVRVRGAVLTTFQALFVGLPMIGGVLVGSLFLQQFMTGKYQVLDMQGGPMSKKELEEINRINEETAKRPFNLDEELAVRPCRLTTLLPPRCHHSAPSLHPHAHSSLPSP